jgi:hypothetical protein
MSSSMTSRRIGPHDLSSHHSMGKICFSTLIEELVLHKGSQMSLSRNGVLIFQQDSTVRSKDCNYSSDGLSTSLPKAHQSYRAVVRCELPLIQKNHLVMLHSCLYGIQSR